MKTASLRELIRAREFLHMPAIYDPLGGLLAWISTKANHPNVER